MVVVLRKTIGWLLEQERNSNDDGDEIEEF